MADATIILTTTAGRRTVSLWSFLDPAGEEQAHANAYRWIKGLRHLTVDGGSFRDRFTVRDDSLWWFTEVYLHKTRVLLELERTTRAFRRLLEEERPSALELAGDPSIIVRHVAAEVLTRAGLSGAPAVDAAAWASRLRDLDRRARRLNLLAKLAPDRLRRASAHAPDAVAAFIHRAFWRSGGEDGAAETYIGPVLRELESRVGAAQVQYVGVGPSTHFRAHRPWRLESSSSAVVPIERYASHRHLAASREVWKARHEWLSLMERSPAIREASRIDGIDCWPLVREQLAGIAWLQWPWSVRSMDEAAATLDTLHPRLVLTYAEAGGWGRALILEARRRDIPSVGLQHGFIYRHWLNYLHEEDEMSANERTGFPRPTRTLLFDRYAADHLRTQGRFPESSLAITGSPRLDGVVASVRSLTPDDREQIRRRLGSRGHVVLVATKEREARPYLPAFLDAAAGLPDVTVVIKPHPAENAAVYDDAIKDRPHVRVVDSGEPLHGLLAVARAVVTVNSTVALDAGVLGVPALSIGLPNNLTPFVDAGAIAGSNRAAELGRLLQRILYDEGFRQQLEEGRERVLDRSATLSDGHAAARTADAIVELSKG